MKNLIKNLAIAFLLLALVAASPHKHEHHKERVSDGAFSQHLEDGHHTEFDHEAILGSVKTAEEFDSLTPEESKRRLAILVRKMDLNQDGFVDRHELKAWILRSFKSLAEEEAQEKFDDVDENDDGRVSWAEYMRETYGMESDDELRKIHTIESPYSDEEQKLIADDEQMWKEADADKDGFLVFEEFAKFNNPEEYPEMLPVVLEQTLREKDTNGDRMINFQEFIGDSAEGQSKEFLITEKEKFDQDYDKDGDGLLSGSEILSWVVPSNDEVATDEVAHLFVASDEDHDDRLSYQEIIDNYETFVGSEATDYGDHLQNIDNFRDEL